MEIELTHFIRPNRQQEIVRISVDDKYEEKYKQILTSGCRFTLEMLGFMSQINICIEHPKLGDFDSRITVDDPRALQVVENMLEKFDINKFDKWKEMQDN